MKLLTKEILANTPLLYANEGKPSSAEVAVTAKFFTPWSNWTWYMTEYDPATRTAFGFVRGHENELGYFSLEELESIKGPFGLKIERDMYFGNHTLKEVMETQL